MIILLVVEFFYFNGTKSIGSLENLSKKLYYSSTKQYLGIKHLTFIMNIIEISACQNKPVNKHSVPNSCLLYVQQSNT